MKHNHLIICILSAALLLQQPMASIAGTGNEQLTEVTFKKGQDLYLAANFISAEKVFVELIKQSNPSDPAIADYEFYRLMCLVKQNKTNAESEIQAYLKQPLKGAWDNQLYYELGKLQFSNKRYPLAVSTFKNVKPSKLNKVDQDDFKFYNGYCNFETGNLNAAKQAFFEIKNTKSIYNQTASYYWGYMNYLEGNYETALKEFKPLENNKDFKQFIPYYTTQIYYIQGKYDLVIETGEELIPIAPEDQKNELNKIVGDAYFETGKYINAIKYLDAYKGKNGKKSSEDFYRLAFCYYQMQDYKNAIDGFEKATSGKDLLAQNAFYHLADCELKMNDKKKARVAFEEASKLSFDPKIEEDALFNYAKLTYELSYSPFNETIKAFDAYISKYPDSGRNDAAFDYLVKVYMTTRNYRDAISSIEKIKNPTPSIKEAYQRVTYYRGLELFNDGQYAKAIDMFNISLKNSTFNRTYLAQSNYWSAEANYRMGKYPEALALYEKFLATPGAFSTPEFGTAHYNAGYCNFNQKKFSDASSWFRKYIGQSKVTVNQKADAANRVGDVFFLERDYDEAIKYYKIAEDLASYDPDYAMFQQSVCFGLDKRYDEKLEKLELLIQKFPRSSFYDDALFEIAKTYERQEKTTEAIANYSKLTESMPQSPFTKKAYLQLGLIYYNKSNYNNSLECYKKIIQDNPKSEEAKAALVGIKNNYVDMNNVDGYFTYTNSLGNLTPYSASGQDSLFFIAAEKSYMSGDKNAVKQFEEYLQRFPNGSFKINSAFYLADNYYSNKEYTKSLKYFEEVANAPDNIFTEQSLIKAAELNLNAKKYQPAFDYYSRIEPLASTKWNLLVSRTGVLRSLYGLENYQGAINAASVLLNSENISANMSREANHKMGKSHLKLNQINEAYKYLSLIADDTKSEEGAEAKYLKAQILFNQSKLAESEKEINDFIEKSTPHQYWLAKSFILLSDVYLAKGDVFQAKHTVKSVVDNYTVQNDGIIDEAKNKLSQLEAKEKESILPSNK
jgi:tetratricopeptide (TPR) repeat protein